MSHKFTNLERVRSDSDNPHVSLVTRRNFLGTLSTSTATAAAVAPAVAFSIDALPEDEAGDGDTTTYRETQHVRTYYALSRR